MFKTFIKHSLPEIEQINTDYGRFYKTPDGIFPSVTSVLSSGPNEGILKWRQAVGEEEANKTSSRATRRGTRIHSYCEQFLLGNPIKFPNKSDRFMFNSIEPIIDEFDDIHCLETRLYSKYLRSAGTVDIIGKFRGKRCVGDFKTSNRQKYKDEIDGYFIQASTYAVMFEERTGIAVPNVVIIIAVESDQPQVYTEKRDNWIDSYVKMRNNFHIEYQKLYIK